MYFTPYVPNLNVFHQVYGILMMFHWNVFSHEILGSCQLLKLDSRIVFRVVSMLIGKDSDSIWTNEKLIQISISGAMGENRKDTVSHQYNVMSHASPFCIVSARHKYA
jgi:hypothetical protein